MIARVCTHWSTRLAIGKACLFPGAGAAQVRTHWILRRLWRRWLARTHRRLWNTRRASRRRTRTFGRVYFELSDAAMYVACSNHARAVEAVVAEATVLVVVEVVVGVVADVVGGGRDGRARRDEQHAQVRRDNRRAGVRKSRPG